MMNLNSLLSIRRLIAVISRDDLFDEILPLPVPHSLGAAAVVDRWHNMPPTILRRIELTGAATAGGLPHISEYRQNQLRQCGGSGAFAAALESGCGRREGPSSDRFKAQCDRKSTISNNLNLNHWVPH
jgi:hypothetical protein